MINGISVKVIEDSISEEKIRLTTLQLRYPRMIHSEIMTHRVFSRNGRSSRAVPVSTLIKEAPYLPDFCYNKPGMQAADPLSVADRIEAEAIWLDLVEYTKNAVDKLSKIGPIGPNGKPLGVHKQWANRPLEWFGFIDIVLTSTHWANFDGLRDHPDAQPEIRDLAKAIIHARQNNTPKQLKHGEWHLPYVTDNEKETLKGRSIIKPGDDSLITLLKLSTARCARVSYKPFDGDDTIEKEFERFQKLVGSVPVHASPAEHQATPDRLVIKHGSPITGWKEWENPEMHGNFFGWKQHRKFIPDHEFPENWENFSV